MVGPDGQPVTNLDAEGTVDRAYSHSNRRDRSPVMVRRLAVGEPRRVTIRQSERRLVGSVVLDAAGNGARLVGAASLQLVPWGEVRGQIVDEAGQPRPDLWVNDENPFLIPVVNGPFPLPCFGDYSLRQPINQDGEFKRVGLVPGLPYRVAALVPHQDEPPTILADELKVAPGELKDLGVLKVGPFTRSKRFQP